MAKTRSYYPKRLKSDINNKYRYLYSPLNQTPFIILQDSSYQVTCPKSTYSYVNNPSEPEPPLKQTFFMVPV